MASNEFNMVTRSRKRMLMETTSSTESETPIKHPTPDVLSQRKTGSQVKKKKYRCSWEEGRVQNELTINLNVSNKSCGHSSPIVINLGSVLECAGMDSVVKCRKVNESSGRKKIMCYKPCVSSCVKIKEPSTSKEEEDSFNTFSPKSISTLEKKHQQTPRRNAKSTQRRLDLNVSTEAESDNDSSIQNRAIESQSFERQIEEPVERFKGLIVNGDFSKSHFEKEPVVRVHNLSAEEISKHLGRSGDGCGLSRVEDSYQENGSRNEVVNSHDGVSESNNKNGSAENVCTVLQQNMLNCGLYRCDPVERHINEGNEINTACNFGQVNDKCSFKDINVASKEMPPENGGSNCPSEMCGKYDKNKERSSSFSSCATLIRTPSLEQLLNLIEDVNSIHPKKKASPNTDVDNAWRGNSTTDDSDVGDRLVIAEDEDITAPNTSSMVLCTDQSKAHNNEIPNIPNDTEIIAKGREDLNSQNGKHLNNEMKEGTQRLTVEPNQVQKPKVKERKRMIVTQNKNILEETKGSPIYVALSKQIVSIQVQCANKELEIRECMERGLTPKLRNKSLRKSLYEKESKDKLETPSSTKSKKSRSSKLCLEEDKPDENVESERESIRSRLRSQTPIKRLNQTVGRIEQESTPRQKRRMSKREFKTDATVSENTPSELKSVKLGGRKLSQAKTDKTPKRIDSTRPDESVTPKRRSMKIREESTVELMESPERKETDNQKCETPKRMSGTKKKDKQGTEENAESQEGEGKIGIKNKSPSPKKNRKSLSTETDEEKSAYTSEIAEEKRQSLSEKKEKERNRKSESEESQTERFAEDIQTSKAKKRTSSNSKTDEGGLNESNVKEIVQSPEKKKKSSNNEVEPDMGVDESEFGSELQTNSSVEECNIKRVEQDESFQRIKTSIASPSRSVEKAPKCTETESPRKSGKGANTPKGDLTPVKKKKVQEVNLASDESITNNEAASFIGHEKKKNERKEEEANAYEVESSTFSTEFESESQTEADDENNLEASESSQNDVDADGSTVPQLSDDFLNAIKEKKSEVNVVNKQMKGMKKKKKKKNEKKMKSFGGGYIPLDVAGPTKFSVVDQATVKNTPSRGRPFDLKNSLVYSGSVKRIPYSELLAYRMKTQVRRRTFK